MATENGTSPLVGRIALLQVDRALLFEVEILEAVQEPDDVKLLVSPMAGGGSKWVSIKKLRILDQDESDQAWARHNEGLRLLG